MIRIFMIGMSDHKGGVESYISNLSSALDSEEFEIINSLPEMLIDGKKWIRPQNRHHYVQYRKFWSDFFRKNRFDAIYFNTCDIVSIDMLRFAKKAGIPLRIIHSHSTGNQQSMKGFWGWVHRMTEKRNRKDIIKYATHLFACSEAAGKWMFGGYPFTVVKNGINLSQYTYNTVARNDIRTSCGIKESKVAGFIGRFSKVKNPEFMLEIAEKMIEKNSDARVVMIGTGYLYDEIKAQIAARKLTDHVLLTGSVDNVNEWLSALDCLVMPSFFEGLPFVLVEAQAAGLPCVVSSNVSKEANLTGLVQYIDLDAGVECWTGKILENCDKKRINTEQTMAKNGYSIGNTAKKVSEIISDSLQQVSL